MFFPMLSRFLEDIATSDRVGLEETRVWACNILCKIGTAFGEFPFSFTTITFTLMLRFGSTRKECIEWAGGPQIVNVKQ